VGAPLSVLLFLLSLGIKFLLNCLDAIAIATRNALLAISLIKESWGVAGGVIRVVRSISAEEKLALKVISVGEGHPVSIPSSRIFSPRT